MKITTPLPETLTAAQQGDLAALDRLLASIQPGVFNLALRVLGHREDAADATQEILLKIVTHLGGFRGEAAFTTWVWRIAHNHLLTARTTAAEAPTVSLDALREKLEAGLELSERLTLAQSGPRALTPQDKLEARQVALSCTQNMLMALTREERLIYVLDTVFDLPSAEAAEVVGITAAAYRQRLSRSRTKLTVFTGSQCGLVNDAANCQCERQLPALRQMRQLGQREATVVPIQLVEKQSGREFDAFLRVSDAAALFRSHPEAVAPSGMLAAIRAVLTQEGFLQRGLPQ